jgi:DNA-binding MarR family transcriptional regulator
MNLSPIQQAAQELYKSGFNVFPQAYKEDPAISIRWTQLSVARVHVDHLDEAFTGLCNIAVMTGRTSRNLCVIECLTNAAFDQQLAKVRAVVPDVWVVKAPEGGQLWFRLKGDCVENITLGKDVIVHGHDQFVLVPPSVLENGQGLGWQQQPQHYLPRVDKEQLEQLELKPVTNKPPREVPLYVQKLRERAEALDWTDEEYYEALWQARTEYAQSRMTDIPHWQAAAAYLAKHWNWQDIIGTTDLAVITALIDHIRVTSSSSRTFRISYRQLAGLAKLTTDTVQKAMKRLQQNNPRILERQQEHLEDTVGTGEYRFSKYILKAGKKLIREGGSNRTYIFFVLYIPRRYRKVTDILERQAVGYAGMLIYHLLWQTGVSLLPSEIVKQTGLSESQVKRIAKKLKAFGLIVQDKQFRYTAKKVSQTQLEAIVKATGVENKGKERRLEHLAERQKFAGQFILEDRRKNDADNLNTKV